ncbi:uncharacterized protein LOC117170279 [Belonocnema kinseyi]|uniref:uncharacterized protein LOC117170279 n=1 Tax=Belonocnema kinseyi TaxID=2817044 RepID=UPI00143D67D9|nr:uncharacterized protein LOC117170279 [Belonocnema kinseyi]
MMKIRIGTLILTIAVCLLLCGLSFESSPNRQLIGLNHSPSKSPPPERVRSRSPRERSRYRSSLVENPLVPYLPARIIVPPTRLPSNDGNGYELADMKFIWLTSCSNQRRKFQFGRYTFPTKTYARIKIPTTTKFAPPPLNEQIVIFTSNGDIYAILETANHFAGLYERYRGKKPRAKINMRTGMVKSLTAAEAYDVPVGRVCLISLNYLISKVGSK